MKRKLLSLLFLALTGMGVGSLHAQSHDELGNLVDPPGDDVRFQLYCYVNGYNSGQGWKYYDTHIRFDGEDVYFLNICPTAGTNTWVKGTYIDETTIRVQPQKYFTEQTDVGPYTTDLVLWHGSKVGYDHPETQTDHYDFQVTTDEDGHMAITCADKSDWLSVADKIMQGCYDFSSELRYSWPKDALPTDIISEQPDGMMERYSMMANIFSAEENDFWADFGYKVDVVWGVDGNVYFSTLTPDNRETAGWIKGEYDSTTGIITVPSYQCIGYFEDYDIYTYLVNYDWDNGTPSQSPLYFQIDERGWIYATDAAEEQYVATIYQQGNIQKGLTAINQYLTLMPVTEDPVSAPDDVEQKNYSLKYCEAWTEGEQARQITVGIKDNDVYVKGLSEDMPEAWIQGTITGDKVNFPSRQLMTTDESNLYYYFHGGRYDEVEEYAQGVAEGITMDYDASTGVISSPTVESYKNGAYMIIVCAGEVYTNIQSLQIYNITMTPYTEPTDAIEKIGNSESGIQPSAIFNLSGQRVNNSFKGIQIRNGNLQLAP